MFLINNLSQYYLHHPTTGGIIKTNKAVICNCIKPVVYLSFRHNEKNYAVCSGVFMYKQFAVGI